MYLYDYSVIHQDLAAVHYVYYDWMHQQQTKHNDYKITLNQYLTPEAKASKHVKKEAWRVLCQEIEYLCANYGKEWLLTWKPVFIDVLELTRECLQKHGVSSKIVQRWVGDLEVIAIQIDDPGLGVYVSPELLGAHQNRTKMKTLHPLSVSFHFQHVQDLKGSFQHNDSSVLHEKQNQALQLIEVCIQNQQRWIQIMSEIDHSIAAYLESKPLNWPSLLTL